MKINAENEQFNFLFPPRSTVPSFTTATPSTWATSSVSEPPKIYCSRDMGELKYTTQGTFGGKYMKANLEIFHPGFKPKLLGFIASVMNSETIILARLNNGDVHMLGDADRGAEIGDSVEATSGKAVTDNNGATIAFVYDTPTAQIYTGEMDSLIGQSTNLDEVEEVTP